MLTYAILGATGQTGSEIVRQLLPTDAHLNIYARSRERLEDQFPSISSKPNVSLFIGDLDDGQLLASCLDKVDVVLSAVAQNRNEPGCSIAQRTALAIVHALESKRKGTSGKCPTLVFIASAAVDPDRAANHTLSVRIMHWVIYHVYTDLEKAIKLLQSHPWIPTIIACPGGLVHADPHSVELVPTDQVSDLMSYADVARAMIMMGGPEGARWKGKYVGIKVNDGKMIKGNPLSLFRYLLPNLLAMICPPLWWWGKDWWPA